MYLRHGYTSSEVPMYLVLPACRECVLHCGQRQGQVSVMDAVSCIKREEDENAKLKDNLCEFSGL